MRVLCVQRSSTTNSQPALLLALFRCASAARGLRSGELEEGVVAKQTMAAMAQDGQQQQQPPRPAKYAALSTDASGAQPLHANQHRQWSTRDLLLAVILSTAASTLVFTALLRAQAVPATRTLRVLCFGDSLTEGFHDGGARFHPYSRRLGERLRAELPPGWGLALSTAGRTGEKVLPAMQERFARALDEAATNGLFYDFVVLLGGTNDIGTGEAAADVLAGLVRMYAAAAEHGARVVLALTLPPFNMQLPAPAAAQYAALNEGLRQFVAAQEAPASVELLDLQPLLPTTGRPAAELSALWDDRLHLTPAGYNAVGEYVYEALRPHVERTIAGFGGGSRRRRA